MLTINEFADKLDQYFDWMAKNAKGKMNLKFHQILNMGFEIGQINQSQLAAEIGMSKQIVSKWLHGGGTPSYANFLKMLTLIEEGMGKFFNSDIGFEIMIANWGINYDETSWFSQHMVTLYRNTYLGSISEDSWTGEQVSSGKNDWSDWCEARWVEEQEAKSKSKSDTGPIYNNEFANYLMHLVAKESLEDEAKNTSLKEHPFIDSLIPEPTQTVNSLMQDSNKSYRVGFGRVQDSIEMSELADNAIAQKMLGVDLYDEVYWASLCEEPVLKLARDIWSKNAKKDDQVTWSYDDWQQRKMRRYQILMTLQTLLNVNHKFDYDLKDPALVESIKNRVPVTHITKNQVNLTAAKTKEFAEKVFGTGPAVDPIVVNTRAVKLTEANRAAAKKQLDEMKKGGE